MIRIKFNKRVKKYTISNIEKTLITYTTFWGNVFLYPNFGRGFKNKLYFKNEKVLHILGFRFTFNDTY